MQLRSYVLYAGSSLWISPSKCLGLEPKWHCHFGIPRQHRRLYHVSTLMVGRLGDLWEWTVLNHQQIANTSAILTASHSSQQESDVNDFKVDHSQKAIFQTVGDITVTNMSQINPRNSSHISSDSIERSVNIIAGEFNIDISIDISIDIMIDSMQDCSLSKILIEFVQDTSDQTTYIKNCSKTSSIKLIKSIDIIEQKYYNKMESTLNQKYYIKMVTTETASSTKSTTSKWS